MTYSEDAYRVKEILDLWIELTGVSPDQTSFSNWDSIEVHMVNERLKESLELDPSGLTTVLLLGYYVEWYLDEKKFRVNEVLADYESFLDYLARCERIYSLLRGSEVTAMREAFQAKMREAVAHYGADRADVLEMINDPHEMAFLRRDALRSIQTLRFDQFTDGAPADDQPQYFQHIYEFWDVQNMLRAVASSPVSGVSLCLMREPDSYDCFFSFTFRNGQRIGMLSDKPQYAHPRQKHLLSARGRDRRFSDRADRHHFPYDMFDFEVSEKGDVTWGQQTGLVAYQSNVIRHKRIADMAPDQVIWTILMFDLIRERFWDKGETAPQLSYTGDMVRLNALAPGGVLHNTALATLDTYKPLELPALTRAAVSHEALKEAWSSSPTAKNLWLEQRYGHLVPEDGLNLISPGSESIYYLPEPPQEQEEKEPTTAVALPPLTPTTEVPGRNRSFISERESLARSLRLESLTTASFGTAAELEKTQKWAARYNLARSIQYLAEDEFRRREDEVIQWVGEHIRANKAFLLKAIAHGELVTPSLVPSITTFDHTLEPANLLTLHDRENTHLASYELSAALSSHSFDIDQGRIGSHFRCALNGKKATITAIFTPTTAPALALLCGCEVSELPDVLQHWTSDDPAYSGNHKLENLDPMEWAVRNPWQRLKFKTFVHLSRSGYSELRKQEGLPPNRFWVEEPKKRHS